MLSPADSRAVDHVADEVARAAADRRADGHGALIVLERETGLEDTAESGVMIHGDISADLIRTIFAPRTALHDGALIIRGETILAAGALLPLAETSVHAERFGGWPARPVAGRLPRRLGAGRASVARSPPSRPAAHRRLRSRPSGPGRPCRAGRPPELAYLHDLAARLRGPAPWFDVVQDRQPANAIARYAGDRGDTIVVVATHGRSGLRDLIMGSVSHAVSPTRRACPFLVVPRHAGHRIA